MTLNNDLESLWCLESKAASGTPVNPLMQIRVIERSEVPYSGKFS